LRPACMRWRRPGVADERTNHVTAVCVGGAPERMSVSDAFDTVVAEVLALECGRLPFSRRT